MTYTAREDVPWTDEQIKGFHAAWLVVHAKRFDTPTFPSNMTDHEVFCWRIGMRKAATAICDAAGIHLGYSYGWLYELVKDNYNDERRQKMQTAIEAD